MDTKPEKVITGDDVRDAMTASGIERVEHHDCSICDYACAYFRDGEQLYFDPGCNCSHGSIRVSSWQDAADWINTQSSAEWKTKLAAKFGIGDAAKD